MMAKKYYYTYNCNKYELLDKLGKYEDKKIKAIVFDELYIQIKESKIIIQQKTRLQHPLQRFFVGKIISSNNETKIVGAFKYPYVNSCLFVLFSMICIVGNLRMLSLTNIMPTDKIYISAIFAILYSFVIILFLTGKLLYKEQENSVLEFLKKLK